MVKVNAVERTLDELLKSEKKLVIPDYQRTYCWRKKQIVDLLDSIKTWQKERADKPLHLGTIVLKENGDELEIIDGQQRLITLSVLQHCLGIDNENSILDSKIETGSTTDSYDAKKHIVWAQSTIKAWINSEDEDNDFLKNIIFCVVTIPKENSQQLAYTFFNALNSAGKKLSDIDLLKAHHLRYIKEESVAHTAVAKWNKDCEKGYDDVVTYLYQLRCWYNAINFNNTPDGRAIFNHFSARKKKYHNTFIIKIIRSVIILFCAAELCFLIMSGVIITCLKSFIILQLIKCSIILPPHITQTALL